MANLPAIFAAVQNVEQAEQVALRPTRSFRQRVDSFAEITDENFIRNFRLSKSLVRRLIILVSPYITPPPRSSALDVETKVLAALNFFATGSYQLPVGCNLHIAISQPSISRALNEVVNALNNPIIFNQWVKFPPNIQALNQIRTKFPGIIGCIDCTHVAIFPPKTRDPDTPEYIYVNRKSYHSINVQLICDSDLRILHVDARFPGSTHDAFIWKAGSVEPVLKQLYTSGQSGYYLLGDSGYPLRPWLMTQVDRAVPGSPEDRFNTKLRSIRSTVERCNGVLKMRFRCLCKHRVLHYAPEKASKIINACIVLHNMCVEDKFDLPEYLIDHNLDLGLIAGEAAADHGPVNRINRDLVAGRAVQNRIVQNHFG